MPITEETKREIVAVLDWATADPECFQLAPVYQIFLVKWMTFNRAYNDLEIDSKQDRSKVLEYAETQEDRWDEVSDLARDLVSLECIGSRRVPGRNLLKPDPYVKGATLYLREQFELEACPLAKCRREKQCLCAGMSKQEWEMRRVAALLRLVYQVRCNLVHGDKRLFERDPQTNRDRELVRLSTDILDLFLVSLLENER
jgi:hypothetical protein